MPYLGTCDACGGSLGAVNGGIGCPDCGAPVKNHPLLRSHAAAGFAEAERKLQEITIQEARLKEQRELWTAKLAEANAHLGGGVKPVARRAITPPQMVMPGMTIVAANKLPVAEVVANEGMPRRPEMAGAAVAVGGGGEVGFLDTSAEPLMAKAKNSAGQQILDKGKRR